MMSNFFSLTRAAVSYDRLEAYRANPADPDEVVLARYLWNMELSQALYPALQNVEIALRNAIYSVAANSMGNPNWLDATPPLLAIQDQDEVYRAKNKIMREKRIAAVTAGQLVAELNFGFWTRFFDSRYDNAYWRGLLRPMLPHLPASLRMHHKLSRRFNKIRRLRNRVFHYEPIWHWRDLEQQHGLILETIGAISPCMRATVETIDRFPNVYAKPLSGYQMEVQKLIALFP
jgi:hypothetical protein